MEPQRRLSEPGRKITAAIALGSVTVFTGCTFWTVWASNGSGLFPWHPPLMALSVWCFTCAILALQSAAQRHEKVMGLARHQLFALGGLVAATLGTAVVVYNKTLFGMNHFTTWHGSMGIFVYALVVCQAAFGAGSVWFKGALFGGSLKAKRLWKYHRLSGYSVFPVFLFTAYLGGQWSNWAFRNSPFAFRTVAYSIALPIVLLSVALGIRAFKLGFA